MRDDWLQRVGQIRRWTRGGERAPHKPLLLLYALGRLQRHGSTAVAFSEAEPVLSDLLKEFGPDRTTTPAYPFHHLQSDGLWVVTTPDGASAGTALRRLRAGAVGALTPQFEAALRGDPALAALIARTLLDQEFPESLHADICMMAGLDVEALEVDAARSRVTELVARRRDPQFRERVLVAYEYRCAMCGFDGALGRDAVGLDAAHVRWWAFEGPDMVDNALCLCVLHHKLFDRGAIGVAADRTVTVSQRFVGRAAVSNTMVLELAGKSLVDPQLGEAPPHQEHIRWHTQQVFHGPARAVS